MILFLKSKPSHVIYDVFLWGLEIGDLIEI